MPAWPDAVIAELAAIQAANVAHRQLRALGVSTSAIDRACRRGRLHRVHRGVYSLVPHAARPRWAAEHAALLVVGPDAVLSHASAAWRHGLGLGVGPRIGDPVHLTIVGGHQRTHRGLVVHRTVALPRDEHHRVGGLPVTSVARTVLDLARTLDPPALEALLDRALKRTSRAKLEAAVARHATRPGAARLAGLLDPARPSADAWSAAERRLLALIRRAGLPPPEANVPLGRYTPDLLWRAERVIVEYDSAEHHSGPAAVRWDAERHNHLTALGYAVLHVTWAELNGRPERLLVQIATALAQSVPMRDSGQ